MKFTYFLQASALAMVVGSASATEPHALRGPVIVSDAIKKSSKSTKSPSGSGSRSNRSGSSAKSTKAPTLYHHQRFQASAKSTKSPSGSGSRSNRGISSSKATKAPTLYHHQEFQGLAADVKIPEFFPTDMDKELLEEYIANNPNKENAAQKRQRQRDERRSFDNPDRTQEEENRERARKTEQSRSRGDRADPYNTNEGREGFGQDREARRIVDCERNRSSCNYSGPNSWCYTDCQESRNTGERGSRVCSEQCRYIEAGCYDFCREDGDSIAECLSDCEVNVDDDGVQRAIDRAVDRGDRAIDRCEDRCDDDFRRNSSSWRNCMNDCDDRFYSSSYDE